MSVKQLLIIAKVSSVILKAITYSRKFCSRCRIEWNGHKQSRTTQRIEQIKIERIVIRGFIAWHPGGTQMFSSWQLLSKACIRHSRVLKPIHYRFRRIGNQGPSYLCTIWGDLRIKLGLSHSRLHSYLDCHQRNIHDVKPYPMTPEGKLLRQLMHIRIGPEWDPRLK